jgi:hypothetical protein
MNHQARELPRYHKPAWAWFHSFWHVAPVLSRPLAAPAWRSHSWFRPARDRREYEGLGPFLTVPARTSKL